MKKHNKWIGFWLVSSVVFAIFIHVLFHISAPIPWLESVWSSGDILTYVSTVALAFLAVWQNQKFYQETLKKEKRILAIEKYVLFTVGTFEAYYYDKENPNNSKHALPIVKDGFNGNKAFWRLSYVEKIKKTEKIILNIQMEITNIGDYPATHIRVVDKKGEKEIGANILHGTAENASANEESFSLTSIQDTKNDKKYILKGGSGRLILNIDMDELLQEREKRCFLKFKNPFGSEYEQEIELRIEGSKAEPKLIQIDAHCNLNIMGIE